MARIDELQASLESEGPKVRLYNASDEFLTPKVNGILYSLVPDGTATNPATGALETHDGITEIRDQWEFVWRKEEEGRYTRTDERKMRVSAAHAVKHLLPKLEARGVIRLTGTPEAQETARKAARKKFLKWKRGQFESIVNRWRAKLADWHRDETNRGGIPPSPDDSVINAMDWLAQLQAGLIDRRAFVCPHESYQTDDPQAWALHLKVYHPLDKKLAGEEPVRRGRRKTAVDETPEGEAATDAA